MWREVIDDAVPGRAAELSFYLTMAFFPLLICVIVGLALIPGAEDFLFSYLDKVLPKEAAGVIHEWVHTIFQHGSSGLLSFSLLFTLWSASTGVSALIEVFNVAYEVEEQRPFWKRRLVALALTVGIAMLVLGGALIFIFGSDILNWLTDLLHLSATFHTMITIVHYVVGLGMLFLGVSGLHYFGPNLKQRFRFLTPGAIFSGVAVLVFSYLFSIYLEFAPSYSAVYGGLGAVVVFMLWLYLVSFILLIGAEVNDEVGKANGERPMEHE